MRKVVFLFGRFQVPTKGHEEMIKFGARYAQRTGAEFRVYTSKSYDPVKNPLPYAQKLEFLRKLFPGLNIIDDPNVRTAFDVCRQLSDAGIEDVTMVVGGDRVAEFQRGIGKYVMPRNTPGFDPRKNYAFKNFQVINSGSRKTGISGTQMREYIRKGKFSEFLKTAPTTNKALARQIFTAAKSHLREDTGGMSRKDFHDKLMSFVDYTCDKLGIDERPKLQYLGSDENGDKNPVNQPSFASYSPSEKLVRISTKNRHPMDIFRSVAHELVHHKQNLDGRLGKNIAKEGATGSKIENEANSEAGKVMRYFGKENPFYFDMQYVTEKAIILAGTPGSGKDRILKEAILPCGFTEINADEFHKATIEGNVVINGSFDYERARGIKESLDARGYQTIMVFVNTSNEVSKQRNEARAGKGRVISENIRFGKWKAAQDALNRYDHLFEKVIEVKNDLDLNQSAQVIQETYEKLIQSVSHEIDEFVSTDTDRRFQNMLEGYTDFSNNNRQNPVGGAGNWGTSKLTDRYKADTPGQEPGAFQPMRVLDLKQKVKTEERPVRGMSSAPIGGDRIGDETGLPKGPGFGDNQSIDLTGLDRQIDRQKLDRWMQSEETKRRFRARYGSLSEQKMKETANKLSRMESLDDPFSGSMASVSATTGNDDVRQNMTSAEMEKTALFKKKNFKRTK